ncbi:MAG: hypothetical protein JFAIHJKO_02318 [Pyrinomonadaceae bacterium]|nr:hypothetical protein [Pyrinomonadaceae bacterium]
MINYEQDNKLMEPLFSTFPSILKEVNAAPEVLESLVFSTWPAAVGELVGKRTQPLRFESKRLTVAVEDKTWKVHLEELAGQILAKLNNLCGNGSVAFVEFKIEPRSIVSNAGEQQSTPTNTEISKELRLAAANIKDASLRNSFIEAATVYLSRG